MIIIEEYFLVFFSIMIFLKQVIHNDLILNIPHLQQFIFNNNIFLFLNRNSAA